jgi:gliding motility-associated-like protein
MNRFQARLGSLCCFIVLFANIAIGQTYNDGPIQLQARVREVQVTAASNSDLTLTVGPLPLANFSTDEYSFKVYARDDQDLDGTGYTGGACLQQDFVTVPNTSIDYNSSIFNFTYLTPTVPQFLDINLDAWEDDIATDFVTVSGLTVCGNAGTFPRCTFDPLFCCVNVPFFGCVNEGDDIRCNPTVFYDNLNYRNGPPCQWTDQGFLAGSCGVNNFYRPHIETFWRYTRGTSCANAINLGNVAPGFGSYTHFNSNECYANNFASSPGNDVFYAINVTAATGVNVSLCGGATWNTYLYLLNSSCTTIISDDNGCGINSSVLNYGICTPGTYYLVVDGALAASMGTFTIVVTENPTLVPIGDAGSNRSICAGQSTTLGDVIPVVGGVGPYTFSWSPTTNLNNPNIANPIANPTTTTTYTLSVTDSRGCTDTDPVTVTVSPGPTPNLGVNQTVCPTSPVTLNAGPGYSQYFWSTGQSGVQTISVGNPGSYSVTVFDAIGCVGRDTVSILNFVPTNVSLGADRSICAGSSTPLNAPPGMTSYNWSTGATAVSTITVSTAGSFAVTVVDPNGCTVRDTVLISVDPLPVVNLGANYSICQATQTTLNAGTGFVSYAWSNAATSSTISVGAGTYSVTVTDVNGCQNSDAITIGNFAAPSVNLGANFDFCQGTTSSIVGPVGFATYQWNTGASTSSISPIFPGIYSLTVTDGNGCTGADTITLGWYFAPLVSVGPDVNICTGGTGVTLTATAGFASYLWSNAANTQTTTVTTGGTYSVIASDPNGCQAFDTLVATLVPAVSLNLGNLNLCPGTPALLDAGAGYTSYLWSTGSNSQFITPATAGNYTVTVVDPNGCSGTASSTLTFFTAPTVTAGPATQDLCDGGTLQLTASGSFPSYLWSNGTIGAVLDVTSPGSYTVTATDANGCEALATVVVNGLPAPIIFLGNDTVLCDGGTATLDAGAGFTAYAWSDGSTGQTLTATTTGTYAVTVTGANGCEGTDDITLSLSPPLVVDLGPLTTPLCEGGELLLDAGPGLQTYTWSNGLSINQYLVVTDSGQYAVTVTDQFGCSGSDGITVTLVPLPPFEVQSVVVCPGESATLDAGGGFSSYLWSTGATTQAITVSNPASYSVTVTFANCELTDEADMRDDCNSTINIPNVFTPNGDGFNDRFAIEGKNIEEVEFWIVDRWGHTLFTGNTLNATWDGKLNGNDLPEGVYFLAITYKYKDEITQHKDELPVTLFR